MALQNYRLLILFLFGTLATGTHAWLYNLPGQCCYNIVAAYAANMNVTDQTYGGCDNDLVAATYVNCLVTAEGKVDKKAISYLLVDICQGDYMYYGTTVDDVMNDYEKYKDKFVDYATLNSTDIVNLPVTTNMTMYDEEIEYLDNYYYNVIKATVFAEIMYGMWVGLFLVVGSYNLLKLMAPKFYNNFQLNWLRQYFLLPALIRARHNRAIPFIGYLPLRSEFLVMAIHVIYNILVCAVHYSPAYPNYYDVPSRQLLEIFIAHRTAILSFAHMPLLVIFAGRNNFLSAVTGWSFSTFNFYHKWLGRITFVHASLHAILWSASYAQYYSLSESYSEAYMRWGAVATVLGALIVMLAWYPIRSYFYEAFLYMHIVLAALFIAGSWYHVMVEDFGYNQWLIVAFSLWAFDRVLRLARIVVNGSRRDAIVEHVGEGVLRISISHKHPTNFYSGSYTFVHFLLPTVFYQSHPFTAFPESESSNNLIVIGRVHKGMTKTLNNAVLAADGSRQLKVLLDGPYGKSHSMVRYDSVMLIAGGIGITGALSYVTPLLTTAKNMRISVIWVVRKESALKWIAPELQKLSSSKKLELNIYITESLQEENKMETTESINEKDSIESPNITRSRPNITEEIAKFVGSSAGSAAVFCCGPAGMNDEARAATSNNLNSCKAKVEYIEDIFGW
ncbi:ferric reductase NAD binding domain-containing protein [Dipodascopsis uninucleata]